MTQKAKTKTKQPQTNPKAKNKKTNKRYRQTTKTPPLLDTGTWLPPEWGLESGHALTATHVSPGLNSPFLLSTRNCHPHSTAFLQKSVRFCLCEHVNAIEIHSDTCVRHCAGKLSAVTVGGHHLNIPRALQGRAQVFARGNNENSGSALPHGGHMAATVGTDYQQIK